MARRSYIPLLSLVVAAGLVMSPITSAVATERPVDDSESIAPAAASATVNARILIELPGGSIVPVDLDQGVVRLYSAGFGTGLADYSFSSGADGAIVATVAPGDYLIEFASSDPRALPVHEWYTNSRYQQGALPVTLADGANINLGNMILESRSLDATRLSGANRYETAVAVSQRAFPTTASAVVVVNGESFPDALSAGPLANNLSAAMLLVTSNSIPEATRLEIDRLNPASIYIVGGTGVVSNAVLEQLRPYASDPSFVYRIAGADRYATSRAVVERIGVGINTLMIATGRNFPDALSAVPAANAFGVGALLLVDGTRTTLDGATQTLLESRSAADFYIVGGTGSVSAPLASAVSAISPTTRLAGDDRYATSVAVAFHFFVESDEAFIANGTGFADALAAGPVAARAQAPVYLARATCMPAVVQDDVLSVFANRIVLVGGSAVLSDSVASLTTC
ncbi:MAG: hypothetical protein C0444_00615 [Microbacterium sp.]|nr:hypothetical protein [Microbacterium sp.]MBA4346889.1 hypothetical protein [Microbacterium sp.]